MYIWISYECKWVGLPYYCLELWPGRLFLNSNLNRPAIHMTTTFNSYDHYLPRVLLGSFDAYQQPVAWYTSQQLCFSSLLALWLQV